MQVVNPNDCAGLVPANLKCQQAKFRIIVERRVKSPIKKASEEAFLDATRV